MIDVPSPANDNDAEISEERIDELHDLGTADAESTGGSPLAHIPARDLTPAERKIYDHAFRNAFARENGH